MKQWIKNSTGPKVSESSQIPEERPEDAPHLWHPVRSRRQTVLRSHRGGRG